MEALGVVLAVVLVMFLLAFLVALGALLFGMRALGRRNRVCPDVPTTASTSWLLHPGAGARLHRRLRAAVMASRAASATAPMAPRLAEITTELEREAVALDATIVAVAPLPARERKPRMAALVEQVRQVERMASQVSLLAAQARSPLAGAGEASSLDDLAQRLEVLEAARAEVAEVEAAAGVHRTSPFATEAPERRGTASPGG